MELVGVGRNNGGGGGGNNNNSSSSSSSRRRRFRSEHREDKNGTVIESTPKIMYRDKTQ
jgi:hypothetical protein